MICNMSLLKQFVQFWSFLTTCDHSSGHEVVIIFCFLYFQNLWVKAVLMICNMFPLNQFGQFWSFLTTYDHSSGHRMVKNVVVFHIFRFCESRRFEWYAKCSFSRKFIFYHVVNHRFRGWSRLILSSFKSMYLI